jgi:hypothetical protein
MSWNRRPLHELVYSIVKKKKSILFDDLYKTLREEGEDIGKSEVKGTLIKLEIWGEIDVMTEGDSRKIILKER